MKKKRIKILLIIIALFLLFPIPLRYKDGGTVEFKAVMYSVTNYHALKGVDGDYDTGIEIKILGFMVYNNTTF